MPVQLKQGSKQWFDVRIGKITSSKLPIIIGFSGEREYHSGWQCIREKIQEKSKYFPNFERGKHFESTAASAFESVTGISVKECPFMLHPKEPNLFGASPDRLFEVTNFHFKDSNGFPITFNGKYILEVKTRAIGSVDPLLSINGSHILQCHLQLCCMPEFQAAILLSFVPETKKISLFLIERDQAFIETVLHVCRAIYSMSTLPEWNSTLNSNAKHFDEIIALTGNPLDFKSILPLRRWASELAAKCKQLFII